MMFKLSPEAVLGAAALVISTLGGWTATAVHWGSTNAQIDTIQKNQATMGAKLDDHQKQLTAEEVQQGAVLQKLDDAIDRLDRIEGEVTHGHKQPTGSN